MRFEKTKALCALQGTMVITDEKSPFEWVGSNDAETCIIILIHGINTSGQKIAACGHLSVSESPLSIRSMLDLMQPCSILSAHLISGKTTRDSDIVGQLLQILAERSISQYLSLGEKKRQAAMHVASGAINYDVSFSAQNSGITDIDRYRQTYFPTAVRNLCIPVNDRPMLKLTIDGRKEEDIRRINFLLQPYDTQNTETRLWINPFFMKMFRLQENACDTTQAPSANNVAVPQIDFSLD